MKVVNYVSDELIVAINNTYILHNNIKQNTTMETSASLRFPTFDILQATRPDRRVFGYVVAHAVGSQASAPTPQGPPAFRHLKANITNPASDRHILPQNTRVPCRRVKCAPAPPAQHPNQDDQLTLVWTTLQRDRK